MFYDQYRYICQLQGLSPSGAALQIGVSKTSVTRWKHGAAPNMAIIQKLCDLLCVPTDVLLGNPPFANLPLLFAHKELICTVLQEHIPVYAQFFAKRKAGNLDFIEYLAIVDTQILDLQPIPDGSIRIISKNHDNRFDLTIRPGEQVQKQPSPQTILPLTDEEKELVTLFRTIPENQRNAVLTLLRQQP